MAGGVVPQEVLDNPEIAAERVRMAADKAHRTCCDLWKRDDLSFKGREGSRDTLEWEYDLYNYDSYSKGSFRVNKLGPRDPENSSFAIRWVRKREGRGHGPKSVEEWIVNPAHRSLEQRGGSLALSEAFQTGAGSELEINGGDVYLHAHDLTDALAKLEWWQELLRAIAERTLAEKAAAAERFAERFRYEAMTIDPRTQNSGIERGRAVGRRTT